MSQSADLVIDVSDALVRRGAAVLLDHLSWQVEVDERWVILGPNGAGKTTLLNLVAAQSHPTAGTVRILGEQLGKVDVFELRPRVGLSTAALREQIPGTETVLNAVVTAAWAVLGRGQENYDSMDEARARALLDQFGIGALRDRRYSTLSEGERKRVQLARAMMPDPELLLLDEPAAGLDLGAREGLIATLSELALDPDAPTQVLVTHHVEEIPPGFTHAMLLSDGAVVSAGPIEEALTSEQLSKAFGTPLRLTRQEDRYFARSA